MNTGSNKTTPTFLKDYSPYPFDIETVDLHFELFEEKTIVRNQMSIARNNATKVLGVLVLYGEGLKLLSLHLDNKELTAKQYQITETELTLFDLPEKCQLTIVTEIYPDKNTALSGLYRSEKLYCTQCEAQGFRHITYYPDRPDVLSCFTTTIVADKALYPILLSNGNKGETGDLEKGRHFVKWLDPFKKPSYLFALVAGNLQAIKDTFTTSSGRKVALEIYVEPQNIDKCDYAIGALKRSMQWDEKVYAREYDLDVYMIVAVNDFNMGAMENKGLNIFNSKYILANEKTATDVDFQNVESVIGHEYFHNWTGNRVTCRDWFQLSLKEGLTVFREQQFSSEMGSAIVKRINDVRMIKTRQFAEDAGPMAHPVRPESYIEINNFYTATVYYKGAEVIRMLHTFLGSTGFRKGMDLYFKRHDGQAVTIENFVAAMQDANHANLDQFHLWYSQAGTPQVLVEAEYSPTDETFTLNIKQSCPPTPGQDQKAPFLIPIKFALYDEAGKEMPIKTQAIIQQTPEGACLLLSQAQEKITFEVVKSRPVPSLLRNFSAPVKLSYPFTQADLILLMQHDQDEYNRWDAAQRLYLWAIKSEAVDNYRLFDAFKQLLRDKKINRALLAQLLILPSFQFIAEEAQVIDVGKILKARNVFVTQFCESLIEPLLAVYEHCMEEDDESFSGEMQEVRLLKNVCLAHLVRTNDPRSFTLVEKQYNESSNMTNLIGALSAINHANHPLREKLFADFYHTWQNEVLLVNKWLGLQAVSELPHALDNIQALLSHKAFDIKNPNKVYALINTFGTSNAERFHDSLGRGYDFLASKIIEIDPLNPQVAARLLESLTTWKRLDSAHGQKMKEALLKIQASGKLSQDSYEIVSKTLQD